MDIEELKGSEAAQSTLRVWISEGKLKLLTTTRDDESGKIVTDVIETKGSPSFITTCTNPEVDDELLNRVFLLSLDESKAQTEKIIQFEAKQYSQLGDDSEEEKPNELFKYTLAKLTMIDRVVIPFTDLLARSFPLPKGRELSVGPRRDFKKLLYLIGVVAWLHQEQRMAVAPIKDYDGEQRADVLKRFIVASPIDFTLVWRICRNGFLQTLFKMSERHSQVLDCFKASLP